jgi:hypothetical protein
VTGQPIDFLTAISGYARADAHAAGGSATRPIKLATVDPAYDPYAGLLPKVTFYGESTLSGKRYPHLAEYVPVPGDAVALIPCGNTYLIIGAIGSSVLPHRVLLTKYTANGTYTPAAGMHSALVRVQASGGAGAAAANTTGGGTICGLGSGGGAGGYAESVIKAEDMPLPTVAVTVGATAAGGSGNGANGNTSSFGSLVVAAGGTGGLSRTASATAFGIEGGVGGAASAGDIQVTGGAGHIGYGSGQLGFSGNGGNCPLGTGGQGRATSFSTTKLTGGNGGGYGGGGAGSFNSSGVTVTNGGSGAPGLVLVYEMF